MSLCTSDVSDISAKSLEISTEFCENKEKNNCIAIPQYCTLHCFGTNVLEIGFTPNLWLAEAVLYLFVKSVYFKNGDFLYDDGNKDTQRSLAERDQ